MPVNDSTQTFANLNDLARHLRSLEKKVTLIFAYNGTGKTRLSMVFKEQGKQRDDVGEVVARDTLYFNAFYVNLLSHGNYSLFEPVEMMNDNKEIFRKILKDFMSNYCFNPELFSEVVS